MSVEFVEDLELANVGVIPLKLKMVVEFVEDLDLANVAVMFL